MPPNFSEHRNRSAAFMACVCSPCCGRLWCTRSCRRLEYLRTRYTNPPTPAYKLPVSKTTDPLTLSFAQYGRVVTERMFMYQVIGNANYSVDTFFFLSGLLVTLLYLRSEESYSRKHPKRTSLASDTKKTVLLLLYRYVRLTPVYFVALLCSETALKWVYI